MFVRCFILKESFLERLVEKKIEVSGGAGKGIGEHQISGCCVFVVVSHESEKE